MENHFEIYENKKDRFWSVEVQKFCYPYITLF